ncbi:MAG: aminotransferase [Rhodospirillaceae bacterium]|nr:aminotransferase [Rhodospirillaceae bacterium]
MKPANSTMAGLGTTVFEVMSRLAIEHGSINLGQGFPDQDGPEDVRRVAADALMEGPNQYPPMTGLPELRQAITAHAQRFYGLEYDWQSEIVVTSGATEALADCFLAMLNPGDEVILLEPLYDSYPPIVERAGAVPRYVSLRPPEWSLPLAELEAVFGPKTKMILLNNPMNPASKVFRREELETIAWLCIEHDVICLCDEVYEHLLFDDLTHIPIAGLPGMRERTLRIASAGKIFSLTGWKVGWACARPQLINAIRSVKQFLTFVNAAPFQPAIAVGLRLGDDYFTDFAATLQGKRDRLNAGLVNAGFTVYSPQGTYFTTVDIRPLGYDDGRKFCLALPEMAGVVAIPSQVFYTNKDEGKHLVRFAFCKQDVMLDEAVDRLAVLRAS